MEVSGWVSGLVREWVSGCLPVLGALFLGSPFSRSIFPCEYLFLELSLCCEYIFGRESLRKGQTLIITDEEKQSYRVHVIE